MKIVLQRVNTATITIEKKEYARIDKGILILLGIETNDTNADIHYMIQKITQLRIFGDSKGKMNLSAEDLHYEYLVVSQFTLMASTKKGNRPSFIHAAQPSIALPLYRIFINQLQQMAPERVKTGKFGADMQVSLINDGPVTLLLDSNQTK
jgi:D-tyrosyl-tRNA(Tyr) deacylase